MSETCGETSLGAVCAEPKGHHGHHGGHASAPDSSGMCTGWGQTFDPTAESVPCPALCGFSVHVTPGTLLGIAHREGGAHSLLAADGTTQILEPIRILQPRTLRAV